MYIPTWSLIIAILYLGYGARNEHEGSNVCAIAGMCLVISMIVKWVM
jgi:hypothetical protein